MNNITTNIAIRRLSAENITLTTVKAVVKRLQMQAAQDENQENRQLKANNPELNKTCWYMNVENQCEKRIQKARNLQAHYPGIRKDAAEALGIQVNAYWHVIYNMVTDHAIK